MVAQFELLPEQSLRDAVDLLVRLVEAAGAAVIFVGALLGVISFLRVLPSRKPERFTGVRLVLGRFLALGLEFQLASDVLRTAIAPSFDELGKLAAVAAIRTALNFFLAREIKEETALVDSDAADHRVPEVGEHAAGDDASRTVSSASNGVARSGSDTR
jgi:uncharacterized membrane protein